MKTLIVGAGNYLLSDEGFGVHFIRHLQEHYTFPEEVELCDAGTMGILISHELEQAERLYIVDTLIAPGEPGDCRRYEREDFLLNRIPVKLSPHQAGIQEALLVSELRGCCPREISLLGIIPASLAPGIELSPGLQRRLPQLGEQLVAELRAAGLAIGSR